MRRETEEWLKLANEDLQSAEYLFEKRLFRMVCYHAQQAVEKVLKSLFGENEIEIPRIHNLLDLNNSARKLGHTTGLTGALHLGGGCAGWVRSTIVRRCEGVASVFKGRVVPNANTPPPPPPRRWGG
jgi:hypothetical protein